MNEEWRVIAEFPDYAVSSRGRVMRRCIDRKNHAPRILSGWVGSHGYPTVGLSKNGADHRRLVHRLVCEAFHGPAPTKFHQVAHADGNRTNASASNLRWATRSENMEDARAHGTMAMGERHGRTKSPEKTPRGERHGHAKITAAAVRAIRSSDDTGRALSQALHSLRQDLEARRLSYQKESAMNDMTAAIVPRSDQINADDLIAGPITITITEVRIKPGEQPVSIYFEGSDKAYRPCKSMARVLVSAWGPDASKYKGRSLTLYNDPKVKWGGMEVGGIRISHMSHIDSAITMALTVTRANKKPFTVKPIGAAAPKTTKPAADEDPTLTEQQALELDALCTTGGRDLTTEVKKMAEVEKFSEIPVRVLPNVKRWIQKQRLEEHQGSQP